MNCRPGALVMSDLDAMLSLVTFPEQLERVRQLQADFPKPILATLAARPTGG